jgi:beta-phosphoglucomutase
LKIGNIEVSKEQFDLWLEEKNKDYLSYIGKMDESEILPDVPKVLNFLKSSGIPMALGSASKNAIPILEKVGLISYFDAIVDGKAVIKAKPDPEVFLIAAEKLKVKPEHCVVFEDALAGIKAANSADMISVGIGDPDILVDAKYNFKDFTEIDLDFLKKLISLSKHPHTHNTKQQSR